MHSTLTPVAYLPAIRHTVEERGQFTFDRFIYQDTDQLPPHLVQWAFLGIVTLPMDLRLVDPSLPTTSRRPSYSVELLHTPSHINNNWLRQVEISVWSRLGSTISGSTVPLGSTALSRSTSSASYNRASDKLDELSQSLVNHMKARTELDSIKSTISTEEWIGKIKNWAESTSILPYCPLGSPAR